MKGMTTLEPTSSRTMNRKEIANLIEARISEAGVESLKNQYQSSGSINYLIIDNLLPTGLANSISDSFPRESNLKLLNARQEKKYVGVEFAPEQKVIEECIYSFQENTLLKLFSSICSIQDIEGDPELYAGGISSMSNSCFLNPHIDNSHDRLRTKYRRLNLLYYVSRGWETLDGGQLVIYPNGIKNTPIEIDSLFNRLVVMRTDNKSLHGVKEVNSKVNRRKTISNYYFSKTSPTNEKYYNSTSFRGFPGETKKDIILRLNAFARTTIKSATGNFIGKYISTGYHRKEDHGEK